MGQHQNESPEKLIKGVILLHDNARLSGSRRSSVLMYVLNSSNISFIVPICHGTISMYFVQ